MVARSAPAETYARRIGLRQREAEAAGISGYAFIQLGEKSDFYTAIDRAQEAIGKQAAEGANDADVDMPGWLDRARKVAIKRGLPQQLTRIRQALRNCPAQSRELESFSACLREGTLPTRMHGDGS
jgi:hypothetical protein